ncbi:MAG: type II toxin-antitoxin system VapC family toxin [Clostridiales bacterium]|jgi:PIN domain nuclease of toxin-antitoxin system|nr:type II toxin-antitoxin system VapC family toxin [Clostridiales bacterium]
MDTHVFLWSVQEDGKLSAAARAVIESLDSRIFLSAISGFEIANKHRIGKLPGYAHIVENYHEIARKLEVAELPISAAHALFAARFEWARRDPFDRMLAAQAFSENLVLISSDAVFNELPWLDVLW